jgi:predicted KAP-like P-loop ATPase
LSEKEA